MWWTWITRSLVLSHCCSAAVFNPRTRTLACVWHFGFEWRHFHEVHFGNYVGILYRGYKLVKQPELNPLKKNQLDQDSIKKARKDTRNDLKKQVHYETKRSAKRGLVTELIVSVWLQSYMKPQSLSMCGSHRQLTDNNSWQRDGLLQPLKTKTSRAQ